MATKHHLWKFIAVVCATLGLAVAGAHAAESSTHAHGHGNAPAKLTLNKGQKWQTDAALRKGMQNIRTIMQASLQGIHEDKLSNAQYDEIAKKIGDEVGGVVANCKLEPRADAQLHLIIAGIMDGTEGMSGKVIGVKRQAGAAKVLDALENYATYFHHPGWKPVMH